MARAGGALARGLDREVHAAVTKYLDTHEINPHQASVESVYQHLKRSNSSLGRKSKVLLEDCISRILDVLRADAAQEDSPVDLDNEAGTLHDAAATSDSSNAMNKRLTASWNLPKDSDDSRKRPQANGNASDEKTQHRRVVKRVKIAAPAQTPAMPREPRVKLEHIGGMDKQIERLKYLLWLPFRMPHRFTKQSLTIPRGVLLHGPPGCGKTMLCEAFAHLLQVPFISISAPSVVSGMSGESEKAIRELFDRAIQVAPSLIFIDEIDAITPKRESAQREMERRIVSQLLTSMDDLAPENTGGKPVLVLAATNRPNSLDPALRRAGRFDTEIEIGVPDTKAREAVLQRLMADMNLAPDVDIPQLARLTPGFVGADLTSLVREAVEPMQRRFIAAWERITEENSTTAQVDKANDVDDGKDVNMTDGLDISTRNSPSTSNNNPSSAESKHNSNLSPGEQLVSMDALYMADPALADSVSSANDMTSMADFMGAVSKVQASSTREGFAAIPDVPWKSVGAYHETRERLQELIVKAIEKTESYGRFELPSQGVLLHGPPGCGKTLIAKAVASASRANFISVKGPELLNKYVGESEKAVRQLFQRARYSQPVIIFFDELDALVPCRNDAKSEASNRVVNAMLAELDGVSSREQVYVIGATNRREAIDPAILRPGRLGQSLYVGLPGTEERVEVFATILRRKPIRQGSLETIAAIARRCVGFSGADLEDLVYQAALRAIKRCDAGGLGLAESFIEQADVEQVLVKQGIKPGSE